MSRRIFMRKRQGGLFPSDTVSQEVIDAIKENQLLTIKILNDRNQKHHRLFRAILRLAFENQERYATEKSLHNAINFDKVVPFLVDTYFGGNKAVIIEAKKMLDVNSKN